MEKKEYISKSPSDTWDIGEYTGRSVKKGDIIALYGELGVGKTQFAKGIARGIGVKDWLYVVSPSFTLMNNYEGSEFDMCHVDLYRIEGVEVDALQIEEFLQSGIVIVEWAERATWLNEAIKIEIEVIDENERRITVTEA
jgi:tRNA threonylcarbamoyladenosine biosynthesis protein TsaE